MDSKESVLQLSTYVPEATRLITKRIMTGMMENHSWIGYIFPAWEQSGIP
ncbi:MAG: hypothetical protein ABIY90_07775 [Puia sp.]